MKQWVAIRKKRPYLGLLDERSRRLLAANEAMSLGYGGVSCVHRACDLSRKAIHKGLREITTGSTVPPGRIRKPGAGRKKATVRDPQLPRLLEALVEPLARGDPNRLCAGPARARDYLPANSRTNSIPSAMKRSPNCFTS